MIKYHLAIDVITGDKPKDDIVIKWGNIDNNIPTLEGQKLLIYATLIILFFVFIGIF